MTRLTTTSLLLALTTLGFAGVARAGGVIIDGRKADGAPATSAAGTDANGSGTASGSAGMQQSTTASTPLGPTEQQIYLFAAAILYGHDAATAGGLPGAATSSVIGDLGDDDALGGCTQTPPSSLALAVVGLAIGCRRRRSKRA
ncbi:MAG: hypothetical protein HY903_17110 [Deltaproteobacteria bacterium]|nr:hypothetical protein [Deltaproteobacteria bacterium]